MSFIVLQDQIEELKSISTVAGERQEAIDHILTGISKLQNEVADAADTTPAYDRKQYSEVKSQFHYPVGAAGTNHSIPAL